MADFIEKLSLNSFLLRTQNPTKPDLAFKDFATSRTQEEIKKLRGLIDSAQFNLAIIDVNFNARLGLLLPCSGYVAVLHSSTPFDCTMFDRNLFRGVAIVKLTRNVPPSIRASLNKAMNLLIPDKSPFPASRTADERWVHSLGANAWIGLYENDLAKRASQYAVVVSGLDDESYECMLKEMAAMHRTKSVAEVNAVAQFWRKISITNRKWLLGTLCAYVGDEVALTEDTMHPRPSIDGATDEKTKRAMHWFGNKMVAPQWFRVPDRAPVGCDPIDPDLVGYPLGAASDLVEKMPRTVVPMCDIILDDLTMYRDGYMLRTSGYMKMDGATHAVYLNGPLGDMRIITRDHNSKMAADSYNALPVEPLSKFERAIPSLPDTLTVTWEDGANNRMAQMRSEMLPLHKSCAQDSMENISPFWVRVSMKDKDGFVATQISDKKRMTGFCADSYEYIKR